MSAPSRPSRFLLTCLFATTLAAFACRTQGSEESSASASATPTEKTAVVASLAAAPPRFLPARPEGDVATIVRDAIQSSSAAGRKLVVYVGASWCEPCQVFHHAVSEKTLDRELAGVDFLEFDVDHDRDRLVDAGYKSRMIPLFMLPGNDGRGTAKFIEGGIKGSAAVAQIYPRLASLLR